MQYLLWNRLRGTRFELLTHRVVIKCLAEAYNAANRTPRGPAYIDIPTPLLTQPAHSPAKPENCFYSDESVHNDCAVVVEALTSTRRPLLLLGQNIRWNNDYKLIQKLIDTYDIPFATVSMARGFISENHPLCVTRNATLAQAESDVVIVIGGALDWKYRFGVAINPDAAIFQLSCLLYTSPSPRDRQKSRMPSSA